MLHSQATNVIIVAPGALHRAAWHALLAQQPDIVVAGASADSLTLAPLVRSGQPSAVLLDIPNHLVCQLCRAHVQIPDEHFAALKADLQDRYGFIVQIDHLVLRGQCAACTAKEQTDRSLA
jgi:hypothetical protein